MADSQVLDTPLDAGRKEEDCTAAAEPSASLETRAHTPLWVLKASQFLGTAAWACLGKMMIVYYDDIGLSRTQIGWLQFIGPTVSFCGQLFWAAVVDYLGEYKRTLVCTSIVGSALAVCQMLPVVQDNYALLVSVTVLWNALLCTGGPIIDAMCLTALAEQNSDEGYGDQRLWCALGWGGMSLIAGQCIDMFGMSFIFLGYIGTQAVNIGICMIWLPPPAHNSRRSTSSQQNNERVPNFFTFDVVWFFVNLIQYGIAMSVVENFLLVFLLQDFVNTPKLLLGIAVAVMCICEVPVFKYIERLWTHHSVGLTGVILGCQIVLALRLFLYTLLPPQLPWLVLLVEPLHGITFAAMWAATVEYGQRLAPPHATARMQALVNGLYYQVAMGIGAAAWGSAVEPPPRGFGFKQCFVFDAIGLLGWCAVWQFGLRIRRSCSGSVGNSSARELARSPIMREAA